MLLTVKNCLVYNADPERFGVMACAIHCSETGFNGGFVAVAGFGFPSLKMLRPLTLLLNTLRMLVPKS
jgi:hypothetical protein